MFDDLLSYYYFSVVEPYDQYRKISQDNASGRHRDIKSALNVANALFNLREHLPTIPTRADIEQQCPDYGILGDIANASKHKTVTKKTPHGAPLINGVNQLSEETVLIVYTDEEGEYRFSHKCVFVKLKDGTERNILDVLTNVLNFWETHMAALGVIPEAKVFTHDSSIRFRPRKECEGNTHNLEIVQGLPLSLKFRYLKFNNDTGQAEAVDLTGAKIAARIYKPNYELTISIQRNIDGRKFEKAVTLSTEEIDKIASMESVGEQNQFINNLPAAQEAMRQLVEEAKSFSQAD